MLTGQKKRSMKLILTFLITLSSISTFAQKKNVEYPFTALTHVNVIDATGSPVQPDMTVIINGNKIIALDKTGKVFNSKKCDRHKCKRKIFDPGSVGYAYSCISISFLKAIIVLSCV